MLREELILGLYAVVFDKTSRPEIFSKETMMGLFGWVEGSIKKTTLVLAPLKKP
jgi:hypothetical protein